LIARVLHFDAFADRPGMGNPAGVLLDARGLRDAAMQAIARAVGFNETAFVLPATRADLRLRYFTPGHEVDLCGHATIGSFVALYHHGLLPGQGLPSRDGRVSVWVDTRGEEHHVRVGGTGCFVRELEIELPHD